MLNSCESQVNALHIELALILVHCTWTCPCHCKKSSNEKIITVSLHKSIRITSAFLRDHVVSISKEKYLLQDVSRVPSHRVINAIHIRLNCIFIAKYMAGINYLSRSEAAREDEMPRHRMINHRSIIRRSRSMRSLMPTRSTRCHVTCDDDFSYFAN